MRATMKKKLRNLTMTRVHNFFFSLLQPYKHFKFPGGLRTMNEKSKENPDLKPTAAETEATVSAITENTPEEATADVIAPEPTTTQPTPEELLAQANERYLRARADFENYRKRMARELTRSETPPNSIPSLTSSTSLTSSPWPSNISIRPMTSTPSSKACR